MYLLENNVILQMDTTIHSLHNLGCSSNCFQGTMTVIDTEIKLLISFEMVLLTDSFDQGCDCRQNNFLCQYPLTFKCEIS